MFKTKSVNESHYQIIRAKHWKPIKGPDQICPLIVRKGQSRLNRFESLATGKGISSEMTRMFSFSLGFNTIFPQQTAQVSWWGSLLTEFCCFSSWLTNFFPFQPLSAPANLPQRSNQLLETAFGRHE